MSVQSHATGVSCALDRIGGFASLPDDTRETLRSFCHRRRYEAGQTVVFEGEKPPFIGCVVEGFLRMQRTMSDGRQSVVGLLVEGDTFGQVFEGPPSFTIEAATDTDIVAFQRGPFEAELQRSPALERMMLLNILNELDRARDWLVILSSKKVTGRIAGFLLVLCSRFARVDHLLDLKGDHLDVKIPISRTDLAHLLSTRTESISRAIHAMEDAGMLKILKPDLLRITDLEAMVAETGDDDLSSRPNLDELIQRMRQAR